MDRRRFLTTLSVAGATVAVGSTAFGSGGSSSSTASPPVDGTLTASSVTPPTSTTSTVPEAAAPSMGSGRKVLVVVQMNGGNDALNTVVPGQGHYRDLRPDLALAESELLGLSDGSGMALHQALTPLLSRWNDGDIAAVTGVGYEGSSRSHFAAMDDWFSATPGQSNSTGWLGRWLDLTSSAAPAPLRAVSLGGRSAALAAERSSVVSVDDPATFGLRPVRRGGGAMGDLEAYEAALRSIGSTNPTGAALGAALDAAEAFESLTAGVHGELDLTPRSFTSLLDTAAGLIELDAGTELIVVSGNGFDTHADQLDTHDALLGDVAGGVAALLDRVDAAGRRDDVMVMTTSEFGRRAAQNGSLGTDHGRAGVQFLAGAAVDGGLRGSWDLSDLVDGDLRPTVDARALYRGVLDWLGGPTDEVLGGRFEDLELVRA